MPVSKPNHIISGAAMHSVKRARDGAANRSLAQDAALGLDNFARLLQSNPMGTQDMARQKQQQVSQAQQKIIDATGMVNPQPFNPHAGLMGRGGMAGMQEGFAQVSGGARKMTRQMELQEAMRVNGSQAATAGNFARFQTSRASEDEAAILAMRSAAHKVKDAAEGAAQVVSRVAGKLSSLFESGKDGVAAIGYDKVGGTSYGAYQIASNTGTMNEFLKYLDKQAPEYARELRAAGPANTGSRKGAMPDAWKGIAERDPEGFRALQHGFIEQKHYGVAAAKLAEQGIDASKLSPVMREVLFSTAVQHGAGGAARIISRAVGQDAPGLMQPMPGTDPKQLEAQVIKKIYGIRETQFGSSSTRVREAVASRLNSEMNLALNMLKSGSVG